MNQSKRLGIFLFVLGVLTGSSSVLIWNYFKPFNTKYGNIRELLKNNKPKSLADLLMGGSPFEEFSKKFSNSMDNLDNMDNEDPQGMHFNFGIANDQQIETSEDEKFYYFTLKLNDLKTKTLNVNVENNQVIIQAQLESSQSDENSSHSVSQSFTKSFPAPPNAQLDKIEVENKDSKVLIKIPKTQ